MAGKSQYTTKGLGCRFQDDCLKCTYEACIYDNGGKMHEEVKAEISQKKEEALRLYSLGLPVKEICRFTRTTRKAVEHYLRR